MTITRSISLAFLAAGAFVILLAAPRPATACGGFFYDVSRIVPVEQNTARMLFEVNDDGTITALMEIRYSGAAEDFSWIIPVPDVPDLGVAPPETLAMLDAVTAPTIIPPPTKCTQGPAVPAPRAAGLGDEWGGDDDGVGVLLTEQVGPYDATVLTADDPDALIDWLNAEGFLVTPEMEPQVAGYVAAEMVFVAVALSADSVVEDIAPIHLTYPGTEPQIPITIATVAAEPEMGIVTWIAGEDRYGPSGWSEFEIVVDDVHADPRTTGSNYYPLVSWRLDQAGGQAIIPEYIGPSADVQGEIDDTFSWDSQYDDAREYLAGVTQRSGKISRLYSRASGWEIDSDPAFVATDGADLSGVFDLSGRAAVEVCANVDRPAVPCGELYCGVGGSCATTDEGDGCLCPDGYSARLVEAPKALRRTMEPTVVCELVAHDMTASLSELGMDFDADPCAGTTCGDTGECLAINGFPTCRCDDEFAAVGVDGELTCLPARKVYGPEALLWSSGCTCNSRIDGGRAGGLGLLLLLPLALRRRRQQPTLG